MDKAGEKAWQLGAATLNGGVNAGWWVGKKGCQAASSVVCTGASLVKSGVIGTAIYGYRFWTMTGRERAITYEAEKEGREQASKVASWWESPPSDGKVDSAIGQYKSRAEAYYEPLWNQVHEGERTRAAYESEIQTRVARKAFEESIMQLEEQKRKDLAAKTATQS